MAKIERRTGPTPNGGVMTKLQYKNDDGDLVDKEEATEVEIIEYNQAGEEIARTYGTISR